jgi:hypothetical protein
VKNEFVKFREPDRVVGVYSMTARGFARRNNDDLPLETFATQSIGTVA